MNEWQVPVLYVEQTERFPMTGCPKEAKVTDENGDEHERICELPNGGEVQTR